MPSSTFHLGRWVLVCEVEHVEVTSNMPRRDPEWTHTDSSGHLHTYGNGTTPTLRWVIDEPGGVYTDADGYTDEYPGEGHYECVFCAEHVTPGMRGPSTVREFMSGASSFHIEGRTDTDDVWCWVTEEQHRDLWSRLSLTTTSSIRERIIAQFVEAHPEQTR